MLKFDIHSHPPTRQDIQTEKDRLLTVKKKLVTQSIISDCFHGVILVLLYFYDFLNGYGLLTIIGLGTAITVIMAATLKKRLSKADIATVFTFAALSALIVAGIIGSMPGQTILGCVTSGLVTASIIIFSTFIGRQVLQIYSSIESLKNILEFDGAEDELYELCHKSPVCEEYRQQALQILRPNLTIAELQEMRKIQTS